MYDQMCLKAGRGSSNGSTDESLVGVGAQISSRMHVRMAGRAMLTRSGGHATNSAQPSGPIPPGVLGPLDIMQGTAITGHARVEQRRARVVGA